MYFFYYKKPYSEATATEMTNKLNFYFPLTRTLFIAFLFVFNQNKILEKK